MSEQQPRRREHLEAVIEDVDWLLSFNESPWHICKRLNLSADTISTYAHYLDRADLVTTFSAIRKRNLSGTCQMCHEPCTKNARFCLPCSQSLPTAVRKRPDTKFGAPRKEVAAA